MTTISETYLDLQRKLHENPNYGVASLAFAPIVAKIMSENKLRTISDYGAGKKRLLDGLLAHGAIVQNYLPYDPVFPEYGPPTSAELVCCIDVLEHIEEDRLEAVLLDLFSITISAGFFSVHTGPASKILHDGRNAHIIQKPTSWWLPRICQHFEIIHLQTHNMMGPGFWIVVKRRTPDQAKF